MNQNYSILKNEKEFNKQDYIDVRSKSYLFIPIYNLNDTVEKIFQFLDKTKGCIDPEIKSYWSNKLISFEEVHNRKNYQIGFNYNKYEFFDDDQRTLLYINKEFVKSFFESYFYRS